MCHGSVFDRPASRLSGFGIFLLWLLLASQSAWSQSSPASPPEQATQTEAATPTPVNPISATDIPARAEAARATLRSLRDQTKPLPVVDQVISQLESAQDSIRASSAELSEKNLPALSARNLKNLQLTWENTSNRVQQFQQTLSNQAAALNADRQRLAELLAPWKKTFDTREEAQLPEALTDQVSTLINDIGALDENLKTRLNQLLTYQSSLAESLAQIEDALERIANANTIQRQRLLKIEAPPLWKAIFGYTGEDVGDGDT